MTEEKYTFIPRRFFDRTFLEFSKSDDFKRLVQQQLSADPSKPVLKIKVESENKDVFLKLTVKQARGKRPVIVLASWGTESGLFFYLGGQVNVIPYSMTPLNDILDGLNARRQDHKTEQFWQTHEHVARQIVPLTVDGRRHKVVPMMDECVPIDTGKRLFRSMIDNHIYKQIFSQNTDKSTTYFLLPLDYIEKTTFEKIYHRLQQIAQIVPDSIGKKSTTTIKSIELIETFFNRNIPDKVLPAFIQTINDNQTKFYLVNTQKGQQIYIQNEKDRSAYLSVSNVNQFEKFVGSIVLCKALPKVKKERDRNVERE